jgi:hypothetical protein
MRVIGDAGSKFTAQSMSRVGTSRRFAAVRNSVAIGGNPDMEVSQASGMDKKPCSFSHFLATSKEIGGF